MPASTHLPVIDLFAGPGGLGEGFSSYCRSTGSPRFKIHLSIECDPVAHQTLELRALFRQFPYRAAPTDYYQFLRGERSRGELFSAFESQARSARAEAWRAELGKNSAAEVREKIRLALDGAEPWVLIGGPPCQAYSLAGRSRNGGEKKYVPENDHRQYLYVEYLQIIADHRPAIFVMENVKGLLSATVSNERMFQRIVDDLRSPHEALRSKGRSIAPTSTKEDRYRLYSLVENGGAGEVTAEKFVVQAERFGISQARHRIFILGVREDLAKVLSCPDSNVRS